jgi:hypothetical protein
MTEERGGLIVAGGSKAVQTERWGATTVEQPRAPVRGSWELLVSVQSSGQCQEVQKGPGAAVHGGSTMASVVAQWWQQVEEEEWVAPRGGGGVLLL